MNSLILHRGGQQVTRGELESIEAPPPTDTWYPIAHSLVLDAALNTFRDGGYTINRMSLAVSNEGQRFFGTLDLSTSIIDGVSLSVGIRNSTDKSFPIGFCCGHRVFVCDNLSFLSEIVVAKRHTRYGEERYMEGIAAAVASLPHYTSKAAQWCTTLQHRELTRQESDSIILRSYEEKVISPRALPLLIEEWRSPSHEEFRPMNAWSLWNAFTSIFKKKMDKKPAEGALQSMRLQRLFQNEVQNGEETVAS